MDGSTSRSADRIVDLETSASDVDGTFLRDVLEHNDARERIPANAASSFRRRFVLVTLTPSSATTNGLAFPGEPGTPEPEPDLSFAKSDLAARFAGPR